MSGSVNKVILLGRLGADPEIRTTQDGKDIARFSLATSNRWKDKNTGEQQERTDWHNVVIFQDGLVNLCKSYLNKGSLIYIEGQLRTRKWQDQNGQDRYSTEVVLSNFSDSLTFVGSREDNKISTLDDKDKTENKLPPIGGVGDLDDEIPF